MCWSHVRKNINLKMNLVLNKRSRTEIVEDIDKLQLSQDDIIFDKGIHLFYSNNIRFQIYVFNELKFYNRDARQKRSGL